MLSYKEEKEERQKEKEIYIYIYIIVVLKKTILQLYFKTFIEKINSVNLIM